MKKADNRSVTYNFIMNVILTGSNILFPLLTYPYASRILKPYGMGMVSFANAIITYFTMFAQLGIPTYGIRVCAKVRDDREKLSRTVQEVLIINMITCFLSYAAFFAAIFFTPRLRQEKTLFLVMGILIFFNTLGVEWLYKGLEQYTYITVRSIIFKFVAFVCIFVFIHNSDDYVAYGFFTVLALVGSNAMNFINLHKMISVRPVGGYHFRQHLKPIFVFFGMSVATTIYTNMDSVMLGFIKGADENGCYDAAVKIKNILVSVVTSLGTVLLPRVSYHWEKGNRKEFWKLAKKAAAFEIIAGGSLAMFFIIFAKPTIYLVSGKLFERAILPMEIIMPTLLLIGLRNTDTDSYGKRKICPVFRNCRSHHQPDYQCNSDSETGSFRSCHRNSLCGTGCSGLSDVYFEKRFGKTLRRSGDLEIRYCGLSGIRGIHGHSPEQSFNISDAPCRGNCILPGIWNYASGSEGVHRM